MFKPLSEFLKSSQKEWQARFEGKDTEPERRRQGEFEEGLAYLETGRFEEAIPHLKKATGSSKCRKDAYYYLAECYQHLNMIPLARKTYERLMRFDYNYRDIQQRLQTLDSKKVSSPTRQQSLTQKASQGSAAATVVMAAEERYEILATIHDGKYSRVYCVKDKLLGRTIALKQINRQYPDRAAYLQQMKDRAALDHPNILRIYDVDEEQGHIAMEYVEGHDLRYTLHAKGALATKMLMYVATQLVNGLHQAHSRDIIHHALTPEHILVTRQCNLKITAFRSPDSFLQLQKTDAPYKYLYIPPEIFRQRPLTVASNIYSFGVLLYEMFVGNTPFRLQQIKAFVNQKEPLRYDETPLLTPVRPIVDRCLNMLPEQRYPDIRTVGEELLKWFKTHQRQEAHDEDIATYKDYLLMAWADGKITQQEATFLTHKRKELHITNPEAKTAEQEVKQELKELLSHA